MNAVMARRVKVPVFIVVAETVKNQTQETFKDSGGEENGPDLSGRIGWFSEFVDENDRGGFPAAKHVYYDQGQLKRKKSYCWAKERWKRCGNVILSMPTVIDFGSLEIA